MSLDPEERATIALLAKALLPEFSDELTEEELHILLQEEIRLSDEEREMLVTMDPLAFRKRGGGTEGRLIPFPSVEEDLDLAVGYNRSSKKDETDDASEQVKDMRRRIIRRLKKSENGESESSAEGQ